MFPSGQLDPRSALGPSGQGVHTDGITRSHLCVMAHTVVATATSLAFLEILGIS